MRRAKLWAGVLLLADIGDDLELSLQLCLEVANDAVVFELLSDGANQDRQSASKCLLDGWPLPALGGVAKAASRA